MRYTFKEKPMWKKWYAWRPIKLRNTKTWVWLEYVQQSRNIGVFFLEYEYEPIIVHPKPLEPEKE